MLTQFVCTRDETIFSKIIVFSESSKRGSARSYKLGSLKTEIEISANQSNSHKSQKEFQKRCFRFLRRPRWRRLFQTFLSLSFIVKITEGSGQRSPARKLNGNLKFGNQSVRKCKQGWEGRGLGSWEGRAGFSEHDRLLYRTLTFLMFEIFSFLIRLPNNVTDF